MPIATFGPDGRTRNTLWVRYRGAGVGCRLACPLGLKKVLGGKIINLMDTGSLVLISSRLFFSAAAAVCAVIIWSKTRDAPWMLIVLGAVSTYAETVYSILEMFGLMETLYPRIDSVPVATIVVKCLPSVFFIAAFCVFLARRNLKPFV